MGELETTAGAVIVCGFGGLEAPEVLRRWLADELVAGVILFKRNIADIEQAVTLVASLHSACTSSLPLLVCVDQEGGRVARFGDPLIQLPPMRALAERGDTELTREAATVLGRQLRAIGINLDFAPVLDVDTNPENPVIGDRSFGSTPEQVIAHAMAFAEGLHAGGVLSCGKHFPGHGDTDLDSHLELPRLHHDRERLDEIELAPFRASVGRLPSLMTAHVVFDAIDSETPATMSRAVVQGLLRDELGYEGAVFSDDLEMRAVSAHHAIEDAGVQAVAAGCDLLLVCSDLDATERLRGALVREAESSGAFRERLEEARRRADALRLRVDALPAPVLLQNALDSVAVRTIADQLRDV